MLNDFAKGSSDELPPPYMECYEILYKDYDDFLGTIKLRDEDLSSAEKHEKQTKNLKSLPNDFSPDCYLVPSGTFF